MTTLTYKRVIFFLFFLTLTSSGFSLEQKTPQVITYTVSTIHVSNPALVAIEEIMGLVYAKLGFKLVAVKLPAPRSLLDANEGKYDGELYRVDGISKEFPNLYKVPTTVGSIEFFAYGTKKINPQNISWG